jgi:hypothetical protein
VRSSPAQLAPVPAHLYTPTETTWPLTQLAFTISAPSLSLTLTNPSATTTLKLGFTPTLGRLSNCQATEDDWRWLSRSPTCVCLSTEENGRFDTSKYVVATNDLRKCLNYEQLASSPVLDVRACDGDDSMIVSAPTMTTPQAPPNNASTARIHGLETRWRLRGMSGSMLDKEERIMWVLFFSPLSSAHCPMQHPPLCVPTGLGSGSIGHRNPLVARHRPVDCPSHGGVHALEGQAQGGQLTESIEQVDLHRVNCLAPPHEKLYWLV